MNSRRLIAFSVGRSPFFDVRFLFCGSSQKLLIAAGL